jgi:TctA family transporter
MIPLMIGMFAISEIIRFAVDTNPPLKIVDQPLGNVFKGMWGLTKKYPVQILRGSVLGTLVGALPGRRRRHRRVDVVRDQQEVQQGAREVRHGPRRRHRGVGLANNSALAGAWIPALVFGIPGDSITAIVIGVLYMKNMNPGRRSLPTIRRTSTRCTCCSSSPTSS